MDYDNKGDALKALGEPKGYRLLLESLGDRPARRRRLLHKGIALKALGAEPKVADSLLLEGFGDRSESLPCPERSRKVGGS